MLHDALVAYMAVSTLFTTLCILRAVGLWIARLRQPRTPLGDERL